MKCKWCGAEVELGKRCEYCGSIAEPFYYGVNPEKKEQEPQKETEYTVQKGDNLWEIEDLGGKEHEAAMGTTRTGRNANGHIITAPEMVAEDGSR